MRWGAALAVALAGVVGSAGPAQASEGSVPLEVATFVAAPDGLIAQLEEFLGPGIDGTGIDFDDSTVRGTAWNCMPHLKEKREDRALRHRGVRAEVWVALREHGRKLQDTRGELSY